VGERGAGDEGASYPVVNEPVRDFDFRRLGGGRDEQFPGAGAQTITGFLVYEVFEQQEAVVMVAGDLFSGERHLVEHSQILRELDQVKRPGVSLWWERERPVRTEREARTFVLEKLSVLCTLRRTGRPRSQHKKVLALAGFAADREAKPGDRVLGVCSLVCPAL